jgi:hypothetical protein
MADSYFFKFNQDLDDIQKRKESGELTPQQAVQAADKSYSVIQQAVNVAGKDAGGGYVSNLTAPMTNLYNTRKQYLTGEIDQKTLDVQNSVNLGKSKLNITGDPEMSKVLALSSLVGPNALALIPEMNTKVASYLSKNADPTPTTKPADILPDTPEEKQTTGTYLNLLKSNMGSLDSKSGDDKVRTTNELNANITNVLKSIDVHSLTVNDPSQYNQVTDLLASPEYGKFVSQGGGIHQAAAANANTILQSEYIDKVIPVLKSAFEKAQVDTSSLARGLGGIEGSAMIPATNVDAAKVIQPVFSGGGVMFRADPSADTTIKNKAKDLNNTVAPIVNKLLRMDAHLNGDTDYKAAYDRNAEAIFGIKANGAMDTNVLEPQPAAKPEPVQKTEGLPHSIDYGNRPDGTPKGAGFFGELPLKGGKGIATEYSMSNSDVQVNGKSVDFPSLVPTLSKEQLDLMVNDIIPNHKKIPKDIAMKATDFARHRLEQGLPLFATPDEEGKFR